MNLGDTGPDFETRALAVARAIHDPAGSQGAVMFEGAEHDGVFVSDTGVVAFEFTKDRTKAKAVKDAEKLARILRHLAKQPVNRYKSTQGYFVTEQEPTAEQRKAVDEIAAKHRMPIQAMSSLVLRRQLIDTEEYIRVRLEAPFGSTSYKVSGGEASAVRYVEPTLKGSQEEAAIDDVVGAVLGGEKCVLVADFGAGKSAALREMFLRMRKAHFKQPLTERIPVHINLRDCYGLRSPAEILRRHSEEIGFQNERSLIAAWRAGACMLLLDGFDEVVPARWVGGARDLSAVRWQALEAVRRLVEETPNGCGVVLAGRPQYFSGEAELLKTLGVSSGEAKVLAVVDFNARQTQELLGEELSKSLPEWVPARPFLLTYLAQAGLLDAVASTNVLDPAQAWPMMLDVLSDREAARISSITPATIKSLMARVATVARASEDGLGPVSLADMREAFSDVCGYEVDEEGLQLLLRLPGLASVPAPDAVTESRTFVDRDLADAAYGVDLSRYVQDPYGQHPLADGATWNTVTGSRLPVEVAITDLQEKGFDPAYVLNGITRRMDVGRSDVILLDLIHLADEADVAALSVQPFFNDLVVAELAPSSSREFLGDSIFRECVIDRLDVSDIDGIDGLPQFDSCLIGELAGWSSLPDEVAPRFQNCEIGEFSPGTATTAGILDLLMESSDRIALVILRKIYAQAGAGRRVTALARGLPPADRGQVDAVLEALTALGWVARTSRKSQELALPVKGRRAKALEFLASPSTFSMELLQG